jgi:hypothetical protein
MMLSTFYEKVQKIFQSFFRFELEISISYVSDEVKLQKKLANYNNQKLFKQYSSLSTTTKPVVKII